VPCYPSRFSHGTPAIQIVDQRLSLLIRRFLCRHPDSFRSVRDLGRLPAGCSRKSGESGGRSFGWLPAWLPGRCVHGSGGRLSDPANLCSCLLGLDRWSLGGPDHSAHIPDHGRPCCDWGGSRAGHGSRSQPEFSQASRGQPLMCPRSAGHVRRLRCGSGFRVGVGSCRRL
jgi:hypothetical protein